MEDWVVIKEGVEGFGEQKSLQPMLGFEPQFASVPWSKAELFILNLYSTVHRLREKYCIGEQNEQTCRYRMAQKLVHIRGSKLIEVYWQNNCKYWLSEVLKVSSLYADKMSKGFVPEATVNVKKN